MLPLGLNGLSFSHVGKSDQYMIICF